MTKKAAHLLFINGVAVVNNFWLQRVVQDRTEIACAVRPGTYPRRNGHHYVKPQHAGPDETAVSSFGSSSKHHSLASSAFFRRFCYEPPLPGIYLLSTSVRTCSRVRVRLDDEVDTMPNHGWCFATRRAKRFSCPAQPLNLSRSRMNKQAPHARGRAAFARLQTVGHALTVL